MVSYYRLKELGYTLPAGLHVLAPETFEPVGAATALLRDAEARAAEIVAEAQAEYHRRSLQGYEEGLTKAKLESVERLLGESALLDAGLASVEAEMTRIVAACLRKLVDDFDDHARTEAAVRGALRQMRREKRAELRVSTPQYAAIRAGIGRIVAEFPEVELVDVVEDTALVPPQIVLESPLGRVEVAFETRLTDLEAIVRGVAGPAAGPAAESSPPAAGTGP